MARQPKSRDHLDVLHLPLPPSPLASGMLSKTKQQTRGKAIVSAVFVEPSGWERLGFCPESIKEGNSLCHHARGLANLVLTPLQLVPSLSTRFPASSII
jgi:hypothetical protein